MKKERASDCKNRVPRLGKRVYLALGREKFRPGETRPRFFVKKGKGDEVLS